MGPGRIKSKLHTSIRQWLRLNIPVPKGKDGGKTRNGLTKTRQKARSTNIILCHSISNIWGFGDVTWSPAGLSSPTLPGLPPAIYTAPPLGLPLSVPAAFVGSHSMFLGTPRLMLIIMKTWGCSFLIGAGKIRQKLISTFTLFLPFPLQWLWTFCSISYYKQASVATMS